MYKQIYIDGIQTYVLNEEMLELLHKDTSIPAKFKKCVEWHLEHDGQIRDISEVKLQPAVLHNERYNLWVPAYCMAGGDTWYPVSYNRYWMCRDCGEENGPVLRPLVMAELDIYAGLERPEIPKVFQHISCKRCGHLLQGYLLMLNET